MPRHRSPGGHGKGRGCTRAGTLRWRPGARSALREQLQSEPGRSPGLRAAQGYGPGRAGTRLYRGLGVMPPVPALAAGPGATEPSGHWLAGGLGERHGELGAARAPEQQSGWTQPVPLPVGCSREEPGTATGAEPGQEAQDTGASGALGWLKVWSGTSAMVPWCWASASPSAAASAHQAQRSPLWLRAAGTGCSAGTQAVGLHHGPVAMRGGLTWPHFSWPVHARGALTSRDDAC